MVVSKVWIIITSMKSLFHLKVTPSPLYLPLFYGALWGHCVLELLPLHATATTSLNRHQLFLVSYGPIYWLNFCYSYQPTNFCLPWNRQNHTIRTCRYSSLCYKPLLPAKLVQSPLSWFCWMLARSLSNHSFWSTVSSPESLILFFTKSWRRGEEHVYMKELYPPDCAPRTIGRGGGLALLYKDNLSLRRVNCANFTLFELLISKVGCPNLFYCILIYHPPGVNGQFLAEFSKFLTSITNLHLREFQCLVTLTCL